MSACMSQWLTLHLQRAWAVKLKVSRSCSTGVLHMPQTRWRVNLEVQHFDTPKWSPAKASGKLGIVKSCISPQVLISKKKSEILDLEYVQQQPNQTSVCCYQMPSYALAPDANDSKPWLSPSWWIRKTVILLCPECEDMSFQHGPTWFFQKNVNKKWKGLQHHKIVLLWCNYTRPLFETKTKCPELWTCQESAWLESKMFKAT